MNFGRRPQFLGDERQPQFFWKWKTTSIFLKMEDALNFFENGRRPQFFLNGGRPQFCLSQPLKLIFGGNVSSLFCRPVRGNFLLMLIRAEGLACVDPAARTPVCMSGIFIVQNRFQYPLLPITQCYSVKTLLFIAPCTYLYCYCIVCLCFIKIFKTD